MDFTREPIIESIITPKDGCKLVVRSSKAVGQEEFFVDALEVVSFSHALFYRSMEKPKAFLVPCSDYEILEVREPRLVLKNVGLDRSIKIGGGREAVIKLPREQQEKPEIISEPIGTSNDSSSDELPSSTEETKEDTRAEKKRDRRRHFRKRRGREETAVKEESSTDEEAAPVVAAPKESRKNDAPSPKRFEGKLEATGIESVNLTTTMLSSLLPPPPNLISETLARYKENDHFKGVFFKGDEKEESEKKEVSLDGAAAAGQEEQDQSISSHTEQPSDLSAHSEMSSDRLDGDQSSVEEAACEALSKEEEQTGGEFLFSEESKTEVNEVTTTFHIEEVIYSDQYEPQNSEEELVSVQAENTDVEAEEAEIEVESNQQINDDDVEGDEGSETTHSNLNPTSNHHQE